MPISRDQLYSEVWVEPMTKVAARHGVSSSFLARVCREMNVPAPGRGYWAKVQHQKKPPQPPLPAARAGETLEWLRPGEEPTQVAAPVPPVQPSTDAVEPTGAQRQPRQAKEHLLVTAARTHFASASESKLQYLRPHKLKTIDLLVSQATVERALDAANAIYKALERKGHRVMLAPLNEYSRVSIEERADLKEKEREQARYYGNWGPDRPTVTFFGEIPVAIAIYEASERDRAEYDLDKGGYIRASLARPRHPSLPSYERYEHFPCGKLCLRALPAKYHDVWERVWREERGRKLRSMARTIVEELEAAIPTIEAKIAEAQRIAEEERKKWQAELAKWERERAEQARLADIKRSREQLTTIIQHWSAAMSVQGFFDDAARRAETLPDDQRASLLARIEAGKLLLGSTDALKQLQSWRPPAP